MSEGSAQPRMGGQPVFILSDDSERTQGNDAQSSNISAGKAVSEAVRTTLGPRGMDKMLVDSSGDVTITNDGATILNKMDIEHPAAQMIVEVADAQEDEVGDGTTTAAVLSGQLLAEAEDLLEDDVHPTTIVEGYFEAARIAIDAIDDQVLDGEIDDDLLRAVAESSMTGKGTGGVDAEGLADVVVSAIRQVETDAGVQRDEVLLQTQVGASSAATELVSGVIVDEAPVHESMERSVSDASVAVIDQALEIKESEVDAEYSVTSVDQLNQALDAEESELRGYADAVAESGADVAFVSDDIDDRVASYLANQGVLAFEGISSDEIRSVAQATGASRIGDVNDLEESDLGFVESISVQRYADDELTFIEGGAEAQSVTIFARGGTEHVVDELERALQDALDVVTAALDMGGVVPGAGGSEIAMASAIRKASAGIEGRKQLAVDAFADAIDVLPRTLARNTGVDPIDALVDLRAQFDKDGRAGLIATGETGDVDDPVDYGIVDPAAVKREAVDSAAESATMIIRIDDIISSD